MENHEFALNPADFQFDPSAHKELVKLRKLLMLVLLFIFLGFVLCLFLSNDDYLDSLKEKNKEKDVPA